MNISRVAHLFGFGFVRIGSHSSGWSFELEEECLKNLSEILANVIRFFYRCRH